MITLIVVGILIASAVMIFLAVSTFHAVRGTESESTSKVFIAVCALSVAACLYYLLPTGDDDLSMPSASSEPTETLLVASAEGVNATFDNFVREYSAIDGIIGCRNGRVTRTSGLPDLWGCIYPRAEVAKVFINSDGNGGVRNVRVMWNDWTRDIGHGLHTDRAVARNWVSIVLTRYAPDIVSQALDAFSGSEDITFSSNGYTVEYRHTQGPAIAERLITVTSQN